MCKEKSYRKDVFASLYAINGCVWWEAWELTGLVESLREYRSQFSFLRAEFRVGEEESQLACQGGERWALAGPS